MTVRQPSRSWSLGVSSEVPCPTSCGLKPGYPMKNSCELFAMFAPKQDRISFGWFENQSPTPKKAQVTSMTRGGGSSPKSPSWVRPKVPSPARGSQRAWTFRFGKMILLVWRHPGIHLERIWTSQMGFWALYDLKSQSLSQISQDWPGFILARGNRRLETVACQKQFSNHSNLPKK
jgi:hypothetical protein